jgi:hypothetical protein
MVTSSFIQFGFEPDMVFNISQISYLQVQNVPITDRNRASYNGYPHDIDKAYSIFVYMTTARSMELIYKSEAERDAMFKKILATLNPLVITKPDLTRDVVSKEPSNLKA